MTNWLGYGGVSTNLLASCISTLQLAAVGMNEDLVGWGRGGWSLGGGREEGRQVRLGAEDGHAGMHCTLSPPLTPACFPKTNTSTLLNQ